MAFMENKRLIVERKVRLDPGEVVQFQAELRIRNWRRMGATLSLQTL